MKLADRRNPLFFESDGDFNPGWALFIAFSLLGAVGSVGAFIIAAINDKAWPAAVAALSFIAFAMLCTAIIVVPIARAKLLAPALKEAAGGISRSVAPPFPGMDYDERGDEKADD
jgi:hypothetical protein